jgi:hypothetical protein
VANEFKFELGLRPLTVLVIGKQGSVDELAEEVLKERESAKRSRVPLNDLLLRL